MSHYTAWLKWVLLVGLSLVFFIPFIIADGGLWPNMFFPYITGKNFVLRILIELLFGVYVLLAIRDPKYRPRASYLMWALGAFVLWVGVATLFSVDPIKSFWSNFERMEGYITILHLFVYFVIVGAVIGAQEWWERFFQVSIASASLQALYSLGQLTHLFGLAPSSQSGARLDGTFGNAAYLAVYMLFNSFITLLMLVRQRRSTSAQAVYGVALVLQVLTLYYTQTRGGLLGFLGGLIIAAAFIAWRAKGEREWQLLRKISLWSLGAIAVLVVLFVAVRNTSFVQHSPTLQRFASISLADRTTIARFQIWHMAWEGFKDRPLTGWGQENFNYVFNKYYQPSMYDQEQWFDRAHNQFIDWAVEGGLPAGLLYVALFVLTAWAVVRADALSVPEQAVLLGLLGGYAFNNLFLFDDIMSSVYFFTILAFAHSLSRRPLPGWLMLSKPVGDRAIAIAAPVIVVVTLVGVWCINAPGIARAQNLVQAIMTQVPVPNGQGGVTAAPKDPKTNLAQFEVALGPGVWPGTPLGTQEITEQLLQFASTIAPSSAADPSVKQDFFTLGQQAGMALLAQRPHDARLELFMGAFYDSFGQYQQAQQVLAQALKDSPQKQQIMFEVGVSYLNAGNTKAAVPVLKQAYDEAPSYKDAAILYAGALYYSGDKAAGDKVLTDNFGTVLVDDQRVLQIYVNTKQYDRVIGIWQNRVNSDQQNPQYRVGLAAAYFAAGDKANAIAQLQKAASLDPALASQIQSLIQQIQNGTLKPNQ